MLFLSACGSGSGGSADPDTSAPEEVTNLSVQTNNQSALLSWTESLNSHGDLAGYRVYVLDQDSAEYALKTDAASPAASCTVAGLTNGLQYTFKVSSYDTNGNESSGVTISAMPARLLAQSAFIISGGLADKSVTQSAGHTISGQVPNPAGDATTFSGTAYLTFNGQSTALSLSQVSGETWEFPALDITLTPGLNTLAITVYDAAGLLNAATSSWELLYAKDPDNITVSLNNLDLSRYPQVTLTAALSSAHDISGLGLNAFTVASAGKLIHPKSLSADGSVYTLSYIDTMSGAREISLNVHAAQQDTLPERGGLSGALAFGANYAVLVGINDYPSGMTDLPNCVNDMQDLYTALVANTQVWSGANIVQLQDSGATRAAVLGDIASIAGTMNPYDCFLFYFSGHGSSGGGDSEQYICTYESTAWISVSHLAAALADIPAPGNGIANCYVILDACFTGNFIGKAVLPMDINSKNQAFATQNITDFSKTFMGVDLPSQAEDIAGDNIFVMTSSRGSQDSWDDSALNNAVFTYYLVEGLTWDAADPISTAAANSNHDLWISMEEAYAYAADKTYEHSALWGASYIQEPQYLDNSSATSAKLMATW